MILKIVIAFIGIWFIYKYEAHLKQQCMYKRQSEKYELHQQGFSLDFIIDADNELKKTDRKYCTIRLICMVIAVCYLVHIA